MGAQLASTVYVVDPETRQTVALDQGTLPEPRLAALVTNPSAWVDGKLPRLPKTKTGDAGPTESGRDDASGGASATSTAADQPADSEPAKGDDDADTKPAAAKKAATSPARGRKTAAESTGGQ